MRLVTLILTVLAATLLMAPANPQDRANLPPKERKGESAKKVKELQKERIDTLKQMRDVIARLYQQGNVSLEELCEARLLVLKAELDPAEKDSDRIALYKNIVDVLKECETLADGRFKAARGTFATVLKFRARRLEAEIDLERAKAKEAKEAK